MAVERIDAFSSRRVWTVEEYLAFEAESELKHEFIDGVIYEMTGGTSNHSEIKVNILIELGIQLRETMPHCKPRDSDMRVRVGADKYVYPDLSVVCGQPQLAEENLTLLNPLMTVEVTSPSSLTRDRELKLDLYRSLPSLQYYLIIDQDRVQIELHSQTEGGWSRQSFSNLDDVITLETLGCSLPLSEIYRGIIFSDD